MSIFGKDNNIISKLWSSGGRPPFEGVYIYILIALIGYSVADLTILNIRPHMIPKEAPPSKPTQKAKRNLRNLSEYNAITDKNLFNADGKIPQALASDNSKESKDNEDAPAVPSQLPLKLLGTIVHFNPSLSVATLHLSNQNKTQAFKIGDKIASLATVLKIERRRIEFKNHNLRRKEYIILPESTKLSFGLQTKKPTGNASNDVQQRGDFDFAIKRSDFNKYVSDLSSVLRQARMVPNTGPNGEVIGYKFTSIQKGSIYEKLGFKSGDSILNVNDEPVNNPTKAMQLYNELKTGNQVTLGVERDGRVETFNYTIE